MQQSSMDKKYVDKESLLTDYLNAGFEPKDVILTLPKPISSKVQPLKVNYSYVNENAMCYTNCGYAFPLRVWGGFTYVMTPENVEGALFVGHPETEVRTTFFKGVHAHNLDNLAFSLETPWLNVTRKLESGSEGITVTETVEQLKSVIPAKDLKSEKFKQLKKTLRKYYAGAALTFSNSSKKD